MKKINIIKRKTAIIFILIIIILLMYTCCLYIEKFYQKEYEDIPEISVFYKGKELAKMLPLSYSWTYKGDTKNYNVFEQPSKQGFFTTVKDIRKYGEYDFPEENTIIISSKTSEDYIKKMPERHKMVKYAFSFDPLDDGYDGYIGLHTYGNMGYGALSKKYVSGIPLGEYYEIGVGEFLYLETIDYLKQGRVEYGMKVIAYDEAEAKIAKEYLNTSLDNIEKIEELVKKIKYNTLFNNAKVDGKSLTLEYDWHIEKDNLRMNNLILFACIPDLETVIYSPANKKTLILNQVSTEGEKTEIESVVFTREEVDNANMANTENLKKFMEQI